MNSLAYFGRAAAPPPHSYGQYYGFGLLKKRKRARVAKKTHIGYRKVRTVVINGRKRALYRRVRCAGRKPKNAARYRKFKRINGVTLFVRVTRRKRRVLRKRRVVRRRKALGFGCAGYAGCGAFGGKHGKRGHGYGGFGQHGHYGSLSQIMAAYPPVASASPAAAHFGRRRHRRSVRHWY